MRPLFLFVTFVAYPFLALADEESALEYSIESFAARIAVREDGSLEVSEEIEVLFHEDSPAFLRIVNARDCGGGEGTRVEILSVEDSCGAPRPYEVRGAPDFPAVWTGEAGHPVRGRESYRISYRLADIVSRGKEGYRLDWSLPFDVSMAGPRRVSLDVELPAGERPARVESFGARSAREDRGDSNRVRVESEGPLAPCGRFGVEIFWGEPAPGGEPHFRVDTRAAEEPGAEPASRGESDSPRHGRRRSLALPSWAATAFRELSPVLLPWLLVEVLAFLWRRTYIARHRLDRPILANEAPEGLGAFEIGLVRFGPRLALQEGWRRRSRLQRDGNLGIRLVLGQIVGLAVKGFLVLRSLGAREFEFLPGPRYLDRGELGELDRFLLDRVVPSGLSTRLEGGPPVFWRATISAFARQVMESMQARGILARGFALVQLLKGLWSCRLFASVLVAGRAASLSAGTSVLVFSVFFFAGLYLRSHFDKARWLRPRGAALHRAVAGYEQLLCRPGNRLEGLVLAQRAWEERLPHAIALGRLQEWAEAIFEAGWEGRVDWLVTEAGNDCSIERVLERVVTIERGFAALCLDADRARSPRAEQAA